MDGVGPTTAKMFLVSTHLRYPSLRLVDDTCQVGDGAAAAFTHLYPNLGKSKYDREKVLVQLLQEFRKEIAEWDPRLHPMVAWTAQRTAAAFEGIIPKELFKPECEAFTLQVNLCEWRKYRNMKL